MKFNILQKKNIFILIIFFFLFLSLKKVWASGGIYVEGSQVNSVGSEFELNVRVKGDAFNTYQGKISVEGPVDVLDFSPNNTLSWMNGSPELGKDFVGYFLGTTKTDVQIINIKLKGNSEGIAKIKVENAELYNAGELVGNENGVLFVRIGEGDIPTKEEAIDNNNVVDNKENENGGDFEEEEVQEEDLENINIKRPYDIQIQKTDNYEIDKEKEEVKGLKIIGKGDQGAQITLFLKPDLREKPNLTTVNEKGEFEFLIDFFIKPGSYELMAQSYFNNQYSEKSKPIIFDVNLQEEGSLNVIEFQEKTQQKKDEKSLIWFYVIFVGCLLIISSLFIYPKTRNKIIKFYKKRFRKV